MVLLLAQGEVEAHLHSGDKTHRWAVMILSNFFSKSKQPFSFRITSPSHWFMYGSLFLLP